LPVFPVEILIPVLRGTEKKMLALGERQIVANFVSPVKNFHSQTVLKIHEAVLREREKKTFLRL
jgi:hypothetical protein